MGNYNPRQNTMMRFKDERELEKFKFITGNYDFDNKVLESASTDPLYKPLIDLIMESNNYNRQTKPFGIIVNDSPAAEFVYVGTINGYSIDMYALGTNIILNVSMSYKPDTDTLTINYTEENLISEDNVKTIFGQSISRTGNIKLYRHQMTITNANDVSVVYIVDSANDTVINSSETFVTVTKATTSYTGLASYLDTAGNVQPAFIRYSAGNVIIQLQNGGISPMKSVSDIVTPISL